MPAIFIRENTNLPKRKAFDLYPTERTLISAALKEIVPALRSQPKSVLDPGAGDGRWGYIAAQMANAGRISGVELRDQPRPDGFTFWFPKQDFLSWLPESSYPFDLIVGNPPFKYAEGFVRHAFDLLAPNGTLAYLLKIGFMASVSRYEGLWNQVYPKEVLVCSTRPSFYNGSTGGDEYAVFVWQKDEHGDPVGSPRSWNTRLLKYDRTR